MQIKFIKTHPDAQLPKRNLYGFSGTGDSGYDLYSVEDINIPARSTVKVNLGLEVAYISPHYWFRMESRSGLFFKHGIKIFEGIIDQPYRGVLGCSLTNTYDTDYQIKKGDRIGQFVIYELHEASISWAETKEESKRGDNGFGSSGR